MLKRNITIIILTALVFLSAVFLGVSTVFRVSEVAIVATTVSNQAQGEVEQIQRELDKAYDKQSIFSSNEDLAKQIIARFPYFRITGFEKDYPNRLVISLSEDEEVYALPCGNERGEYFILGADGTILEIRQDYANRSDTTKQRKNLLITGLDVVGEKGGLPTGDTSFAYTIAFCDKVNELLGGIQRNIQSVEVVKGGSAEDTIFLRLTTFEGVKMYIRNPSLCTSDKAILAVEKYFSLSDSERTTGMIVVLDTSETIKANYFSVDEFAMIAQ